MTTYNGIRSGQCFRLTDEDTAVFLSGGHISCSAFVWKSTHVPLHVVSSTPKIKVFSAINPYCEYSQLIIDVDSQMGYFENSGNHESDITITPQTISYTGLPYIASDIPDPPFRESNTVIARAEFSETAPWFTELVLECLKTIIDVPELNELVCMVPYTKERTYALCNHLLSARRDAEYVSPVVDVIKCERKSVPGQWTLYNAFISEYTKYFSNTGEVFLIITLTGSPVHR